MSINELIETIITERKAEGIKITKKDIADHLGISRQNLVNKLKRDTFSPQELSKIAEKLGCELLLRDDENEYQIKY